MFIEKENNFELEYGIKFVEFPRRLKPSNVINMSELYESVSSEDPLHVLISEKMKEIELRYKEILS